MQSRPGARHSCGAHCLVSEPGMSMLAHSMLARLRQPSITCPELEPAAGHDRCAVGLASTAVMSDSIPALTACAC